MSAQFWIGLSFGTIAGLMLHMLWIRSMAAAILIQHQSEEYWWNNGEKPWEKDSE